MVQFCARLPLDQMPMVLNLSRLCSRLSHACNYSYVNNISYAVMYTCLCFISLHKFTCLIQIVHRYQHETENLMHVIILVTKVVFSMSNKLARKQSMLQIIISHFVCSKNEDISYLQNSWPIYCVHLVIIQAAAVSMCHQYWEMKQNCTF